jgi:superfamily I DNA and/or RNA helicase
VSNYISQAQETTWWKLAESGDLAAQNSQSNAYYASVLDIKAASKLPWESKIRTLAAWKLKFVSNAKVADANPENTRIAAQWSDAYRALLLPTQDKRLTRKAKAQADQEWSGADRATVRKIMEKVQVVFCTCNMSAHNVLKEAFKPAILFFDEVGQITEPGAMVPMMHLYWSLRAIFFSGDDHQLAPVVTKQGYCEYHQQQALSPFVRLHRHRLHPSTLLKLTYRFSQARCAWISKQF